MIAGPVMGVALCALLVILCFNGGGYYAGTTGAAAAVAALALCARTALVRRPFPGAGWPLAAGALAFAGLAVLALVSSDLSDSTARAIVEYDRTLLYLLLLVAFGSVTRTPGRLRWVLYGLAAAALVVCIAGLVSRLAPDVWPTEPNLLNERLSFPITYWNSVGLFAALGCVVSVHLAASEREPAALRVLGAAALPLLAATLVLTFSRSGIAVAAGGAGVYLLVARPRGAVGAVVALAGTVAYAVSAALGAELLARPDPTTTAAIAQGHDLAVVLAACAGAAALLRLVTLPLDGLLTRGLEPSGRRRVARGLGALAVLGCVGLALTGGAVQAVDTRVDAFLDDAPVDEGDAPLRERLTRTGGKSRSLFWRHSLDQFEAAPWRGSGAGTFKLTWEIVRPEADYQDRLISVVDGHSVYAETLGELGLPGFALLVTGLLVMLGRFAWLARGPDRAAGAALLAAGLAWAVHAGFDWDWEVPGITAWLFAGGGLALARAAPAADAPAPRGLPWYARVPLALGFAGLAILPAQVALSQRHLDRAAGALRAGDCVRALPSARGATDALDVRPEPLQIAAVCEIRAGDDAAALSLVAQARRRDPGDWSVHYVEALIRATSGRDPRPAVRRARLRDPQGRFVAAARKALSTGSRSAWRRRGPRLPLPRR